MRLWVRVRGLALAGLVLGGVFVGLSTASFVTATIAVAQTASSIVVEGNRRVESDTIRSYFRVGPGERLDAMKVDEGVKALFATGLFADVRPTCEGSRLIVTVVENSVISRIQFEGNKRVKDEQLLGEIQSKPRGALSRPIVQADVQRIVEIYRRNGRYDVRVDAEDHRPAEQPRRPRVRDQRRRQDHRQGHRFRRQPRLFGLAPAATSSRPARAISSASSRTTICMIPTGSSPTANCCAACI